MFLHLRYKTTITQNGRFYQCFLLTMTKKMTQQQEKAREIVIKIQFQKDSLMFEQAKNCALMEVDETITVLSNVVEFLKSIGINGQNVEHNLNKIQFYNEVKLEIVRL